MPRADINFDELVAAPVLGEGVFGRVLDLGDGTVLKAVREKCAGIGSGRETLEREWMTLTTLTEAGELDGLIPVPCARGDVPHSSALAKDGFETWLRMTKMPGQQLHFDGLARLSAPEQSAIGKHIGQTLARVHRALSQAMAATGEGSISIEVDDAYREIDEAVKQIGDPLYCDAIQQLMLARRRVPVAILAVPSHGDFNISNLMFTPDRQVCAILDFAECGTDFPEKDISDIVTVLPSLSRSVICGYEEESSFRIDSTRLNLGLAENALYDAVIGIRSGDMAETAQNRALLTTHLQRLAP